jgi:hypothetical protein
MTRGLVMGGASVGLSVLLAALLLTTPSPERRRAAEPEVQAPAKPLIKAAPVPRTVKLPPPPRKEAPPPLRALNPATKQRAESQPALPRKRQIMPLRPRRGEAPREPKPSARAAPDAKTPNAKAAEVKAPNAKAITAQGRALLRLLEHGQGPAIELAWPRKADERARLYRRFRDCFGMRVALRRGGGELFIAGSPRGQSWRPNRDRYSGFARQPAGRLAAAERRDLRAIARHHDLPNWAAAMRIFPRYVDARLLGGLEQLLAAGYAKAGSIRARYHLRGGGIVVREIQVDGRAIPGSVDLGGICGRT